MSKPSPAALPRALPWTLIQYQGYSFIAIPAVSAEAPVRATILALDRAPQVRLHAACRLALRLEAADGRVRLFALDACSPQAERSVLDAGFVGVSEECAAAPNGVGLAYVANVEFEAL